MTENVKDAPRYFVRCHGRGGQGAVTAAQLCMMAFDGLGTCMPTFGAERMGSPVASFVKMSKDYEKVRTNEQVYSPAYVCVLDDSLLVDVDCTAGILPGGYLIVNTCKPIEEIKETISKNNPPEINICLIDATEIALEYLGRNITNTIILGALLKVAPHVITLEQLSDAIAKQFHPRIAQKNLDAIKIVPDKTIVFPCDESVKLDYEKDFKEDWSHIGLGKLGAKDLQDNGVWYTSDIEGGSARVNTGSWGVSIASYHDEFCTQCSQCWVICPDFAILREEKDGKWQVVGVDAFHCKGCGLCASVCPGKRDKETKEVHKALTMTMKC